MKKSIVLLHGWGGTKESLSLLGKRLEQYGYSVHILEMPGHGGRELMPHPWSMNDFSNWLATKIKELNVSQDFILAGHSFGGRLIIDSVTSDLLTPKAIVLIDSSGVKPKNSVKKRVWKIMAHLAKTLKLDNQILRKIVYRYLIREADYLKTTGALKETFKIINEEFYDEKLSKVRIPTLILWGDKDNVTPLWMGKTINDKIKGSVLKVFDAKHSLPLVLPDEVALEINKFIENL